MKNFYVFITAIFFVLNSCSTAEKLESDVVDKKNLDLEPFTSISVYEGIEVVLHESFNHRAEISSNFLEYVRLEVDTDGNLVIDMDQPARTTFKKNETKVEVWAVNVNKFHASSYGNLKIDGRFKDDEQWINVSSYGEIEYNLDVPKVNVEASSYGEFDGKINAEELNASASSYGDISIKGKVKNGNFTASSYGDIDAKGLETDYVNAKISSNGDLSITANQVITAQVSSKGDLKYKANGTLKLDIEKSSGGDVKEIKGIF